jgi:CubicO group peptidase (beta-lactamase class C family)
MRRDSSGSLVVALMCVAMLSGQTGTASDEALKREVEAVFSDVEGVPEPGYAVGVVRGGELWYGSGFGASNLDYGLPITTRSVFNVASLSKQFTAACLAILVLRGQVDLDDSVREYLPEMPARLGAVRIAHLVYMTSGLPEYYNLRVPAGGTGTWTASPSTTRSRPCSPRADRSSPPARAGRTATRTTS